GRGGGRGGAARAARGRGRHLPRGAGRRRRPLPRARPRRAGLQVPASRVADRRRRRRGCQGWPRHHRGRGPPPQAVARRGDPDRPSGRVVPAGLARGGGALERRRRLAAPPGGARVRPVGRGGPPPLPPLGGLRRAGAAADLHPSSPGRADEPRRRGPIAGGARLRPEGALDVTGHRRALMPVAALPLLGAGVRALRFRYLYYWDETSIAIPALQILRATSRCTFSAPSSWARSSSSAVQSRDWLFTIPGSSARSVVSHRPPTAPPAKEPDAMDDLLRSTAQRATRYLDTLGRRG